MIMGLVRTGLFVLGGGIITVALVRHFTRQVKLAEQYSYKIRDIKVLNIQKDQVDIAMALEFTNKSSINAVITDLNINAYLEGVFVGHLQEQGALNIPAESSATWHLKLSFDPGKVGQAFKATNIFQVGINILKQKDIRMTLEGKAQVESGIVKFTVPIKTSYGKQDILT